MTLSIFNQYPSDEIVITNDNSKAPDTPKFKLTIRKEIGTKDGDEFSYLSQGYIQILGRNQEGLKEYAIENEGNYFYYNPNNEIAAILMKDFLDDNEDVEDLLDSETIKFIDLANDDVVKEAFKFMAYYWSIMSLGFAHLEDRIEITELDDESEETDNFGLG